MVAQRTQPLQRLIRDLDVETQQAALFRYDYDRGLGMRHPAHSDALELYLDAPKLRIGVEGGLLCGQTSEDIGELMAVDAPVIDAYHALFFDVRPRLTNVGWISAVVFGGLAHLDAQVGNARDIALRIAWVGGWDVFQPLLRAGSYTPAELAKLRDMMVAVGSRRAAGMMFTAGNYPGSMEFINAQVGVTKLTGDGIDTGNPAAEMGRAIAERFAAECIGEHASGRRLQLVADVSAADNLTLPAREKRVAAYEEVPS